MLVVAAATTARLGGRIFQSFSFFSFDGLVINFQQSIKDVHADLKTPTPPLSKNVRRFFKCVAITTWYQVPGTKVRGLLSPVISERQKCVIRKSSLIGSSQLEARFFLDLF